jgi:hypothetical protein
MSVEDNQVVLKQFFFLSAAPFLKFKVPKDAQILKVMLQYQTVLFWYLCSPDDEQEERVLAIIKDGETIDSEWYQYLDTLYFNELAYHIFEGYTG